MKLTQSTLHMHKFHVKHHVPKGGDLTSFFHNNYWLHCQNYHLPDCFQQPDFPHFQCWRAFTHIQTFVTIYIIHNAHFWPFFCTINLWQPFILITFIFIAQWNFHTVVFPSILLSFLGTSYSSSSISVFSLDTLDPLNYNLRLFLLSRLSELE